MSTGDDRALVALRSLLRSSHLAGPDDLPALVEQAAAHLGADRALLYLADYDQVELVPLNPAGGGQVGHRAHARLTIDGTLGGRAFSTVVQQVVRDDSALRLWTPVLDGAERLGVLRLDLPAGRSADDELRASCWDIATLLAEMVMTRTLYGDAVEQARRRSSMTLPAELQWRLLPPLTFVTPRVALAGILAPTAEVAGDSFDYALNGRRLHVTILDAMGHGLEATLLAAVAIAALRNARRAGLDLSAAVHATDRAVATQFGSEKFVTAVVGELDVDTGWWSWITCGHHPALLVRGGHVVKMLSPDPDPPLGIAMFPTAPTVSRERLQPGDRLLLYTDGVIEARDASGRQFGVDRLVELVTRQASSGRPTPETLRRLNAAILAHQHGVLQDDATTVLVEWLSDAPSRTAATPAGTADDQDR
jgi:hypothetical protein